MGKLSDSEKKAITERVRGLGLKHLQAGMSTSSRVICHNCGYAKLLAGSIHYDQYRLCNDCALSYELAKAEGAGRRFQGYTLAAVIFNKKS